MSSIISKLADEIKLHGSYEAYCAFRDNDQVKKEDPEDIPYFPDPEELPPKPEPFRTRHGITAIFFT